jgi:hypothetical protein
MVETIAPVVHGGRNRSYWTAIALHTLGATLSAALFGAFLGGLGHVLGAPWGDAGLIALAVVAGIYALRELFGLPIPLPDLDRQVPEWWRTFFSKNVAAFLYGIGLGIGFLTYLSFGTYVAVMTGAFISGDVRTGAALCGAFGLSRSLALPATSMIWSNASTRLIAIGELRYASLANGLVCTTVASIALWAK